MNVMANRPTNNWIFFIMVTVLKAYVGYACTLAKNSTMTVLAQYWKQIAPLSFYKSIPKETLSLVGIVQNDQGCDNPWDPTAQGQQKYDKNRATPFSNYGKGREKYGQQYS